jgi:MFS family permease
MVGTLSRITSLLLAVSILLIGHGLQLTLLPVHAEALGWSTSAVGLTGSFYFLGFVAGCIVIPAIVAGVGPIRSFMVMAAIATVALLGAGLFAYVPAWCLLRFASGFALSGLYLVIESWLSDVSPSGQRGTILAIYTMISLLGMALGRILMGLGSAQDLELLMLGAVLISLAIVFVGLARVASPLRHRTPPTIRIRTLRFCRARRRPLPSCRRRKRLRPSAKIPISVSGFGTTRERAEPRTDDTVCSSG